MSTESPSPSATSGSSTSGHIPMIILVGIGAGFLSGLFGVGGGILIVPGLVLVAKMDQRMAHGTSLAAVLPIAGSSMITYWVQDHIDWPVALFLAIGAVAGAVLGTKLLHVLPHRTLGIAFSALPSLNHQLPLVGGSVETVYSDEPPMYAVVTIEDRMTVVHSDAYLHRAPARMAKDAERGNWY